LILKNCLKLVVIILIIKILCIQNIPLKFEIILKDISLINAYELAKNWIELNRILTFDYVNFQAKKPVGKTISIL
jgi:hypothetical protein